MNRGRREATLSHRKGDDIMTAYQTLNQLIRDLHIQIIRLLQDRDTAKINDFVKECHCVWYYNTEQDKELTREQKDARHYSSLRQVKWSLHDNSVTIEMVLDYMQWFGKNA